MKMRFFVFFVFIFSYRVYAINTVDTGFQVNPDDLTTIVAHGICKKVVNNDSRSHFVATKTFLEWSNFIANHPSDLDLRDCVASCSNMHKMGETNSGVYDLEVPGVGPMPLYCEFTEDGGGWTRIFRHNTAGGYFANPNAALNSNQTNPEADLYSILDHLESFRRANNFTFRQVWPTLDVRNIWSQLSNPTFDTDPMGYRPIDIEDGTRHWRGLELSNRPSRGITNSGRSLIDGSVNHNNWWFAIGATDAYNGGIPGAGYFESSGVPEVRLYVHDGGLYPTSCQHILDMGESRGSGIYTIYPDRHNPVDTYCEMDIDDGGWTLFYANAADADMPIKESYMTHILNGTGISFYNSDANHPYTAGALNIKNMSATQIMTRDVANWGAEEFSTIEFQNPVDLENFVLKRSVSHANNCESISGAGMFVFRNSNGMNYWFDKMTNFGASNTGLGWGDCHPAGLDQTDGSDVENYPRHWTYSVSSANDSSRVRGIGGFNLGDLTAVGRIYVRENFDRPKNCMDILLSGMSQGDGSYTIYPEGNAITVECDMTTQGGGWTKIWHGYPSHARYNDNSEEIYSRSDSIAFNQMRMEGVNLDVNIVDTTLETAYLKKTIPEYYQQVIDLPNADSPRVRFSDFSGAETVELAANSFLMGYGNNWRVFYTCVNVDPLTADRIFLGGSYSPGCPISETFDQSSISTCTGGGNNYCTNSMSSTETDAAMGLTLKEYQETRIWVRSLPSMRSCKEIRDRGFASGDGVYLIDPDGPEGPTKPFRAYCDMTTDGGGWTLVWSNTRGGSNKPVTGLSYADSRTTRPRCSRAQGSAFDHSGECLTMVLGNTRNWPERFNYFLGLDHWNNIGGGEDFEMRYSWSADYGEPIHLEAVGVVKAFSPAQNYQLNVVSHRNTTSGNSPGIFTSHNGRQWSAFDRDNDTNSGNCATFYDNSPFWYHSCWSGSFNGGGEDGSTAHYNGAYWLGSTQDWGTASGTGAGNGWVYIREFKSDSELKSSCKEILAADPGASSGVYTISLTPHEPNSTQTVYCNMTTDGGGWTLVAYSNGTATANLPSNFFVASHSSGNVFDYSRADSRASLNPEEFSLERGTTDAMFVSPSYNGGAPIIDNGFGTWDYNKTKCTGPLFHTSRTAGCTGQSANDDYATSDAFNIAFFSGNEGIVPNYSGETCYNGKGSCDFKFFLR